MQSIYNKSLKSRYDKTKKQKLFLQSKLRKGKFEIKSAKHYLMILKGFTYLLKKQNSKIKIEDNTAEKLTHNLFHTKGSNFSTTEIETNVKINNKILLEYLIFLIRDKGFIKCDLNKIPLIVSKNINYKAKGFSYKNLYKLFNEIICENELTFKGVTSVRALNNEII